MNSELIVKDVDFNGATLRAAQDPDGKIWIGVRWVCQGMGFSEDRMKNERKKIQKDIVLNEGVKFYPLGSGNSDTPVLCLDLNYVPLWLAKIAITPTMQKENPKLVEKLINYQLRAKDVLAAAFLKDRVVKEDLVPVYKQQGNMIHLQLPDIPMPVIPDYTDRFNELNQKVDKLYTEMGKFASMMMQVNTSTAKLNSAKKEDKDSAVNKPDHVEDDFSKWKKKIYVTVNLLTKCYRFTDRNHVLHYLYEYMNNTYGIVWEQVKKEYKERNHSVSKVKTLELIYDDKQLTSIFECALSDLYEKYKSYCKDQTILIMQPLAERYNDTSNGYAHTCRRVYAKMNELDPNINWKSLEKRYISKYGRTTARKIKIIEKNPELLKKFQKAVNIILAEGK